MRRYIFNIDPKQIEIRDIDVAIVGSGLAGLYAAHHLSPSLNCALFAKGQMETSSSSLAQGGIAAVTEKDDAFMYHFYDTMNAGAGLCDESAVMTIVEEAPKDIGELLKLGTKFDLDSEGRLLTTREGGHGMNRILHAGGDATGLEMVRTLKETVKSKPGVCIHENSFVADVITQDGHVAGLIVFEHGSWYLYRTGFVILASGGLGQLYRYTTNPAVATGDGFAMAMRAGAVMENMEFIQFHPTGLYTPESRNKQCFLISEALRGEGGILSNDAGERFMKARHRLAELAPRDIVAREIYRQIQHQASPYVKLDITHKPADFLIHRFPTIYKTCLEHGIDITKQFIPVGPVQHYMMGGIKTNLHGETNIPGLLACGEVACTGVHGANRLASNSTLECLVFGRHCAETVGRGFTGYSTSAELPEEAALSAPPDDSQAQMIDLKGIMVKQCGILRDGETLGEGLRRVEAMRKPLDSARLVSQKDMELYNMLILSQRILTSALARTESVGAHFRTDFGGYKDDD